MGSLLQGYAKLDVRSSLTRARMTELRKANLSRTQETRVREMAASGRVCGVLRRRRSISIGFFGSATHLLGVVSHVREWSGGQNFLKLWQVGSGH